MKGIWCDQKKKKKEKNTTKNPSYSRFISPAVFGLWEDTCYRNFVWENWENLEGNSGFVYKFNMSTSALFEILFAKLLLI